MIDLSIILITYNRANYLRSTLDSLANSFCREAEIIILNNCSTDNTFKVCQSFQDKFVNFQIITHPFNIGGNANILRAYEFGTCYYKWIVCDDDILDFKDNSDLIDALNEKKLDLIIVTNVGVSNEQYGTINKLGNLLISKHSETFWTMGFVPAVIFRSDAVNRYVSNAYNKIFTYYQQLFVLLHSFNNDTLVYTLKTPILERGPAPTGIGSEIVLKWILSFDALKDKKARRRAIEIVFNRRKLEPPLNYITRYSRFIFYDLQLGRSRIQILRIFTEMIFRCPTLSSKLLLFINCTVIFIPDTLIKIFKKWKMNLKQL